MTTGEQGAKVAPTPGNLVRLQSATIWLLPLPLYLGVIVAFLLPFVSVECGDAETRALTGVELVRGDIELVAAEQPQNPLEQENVDRAVGEFSGKARVAFIFAIAAAVLVLVLGWSSHPAGSLAGVTVVIGMVLPLLFVPMFVGGLSVMSSAPTVHHHSGLYLAALLATVALVVDVAVFRSCDRAAGNAKSLPLRVLVIGSILYVVAAGALFFLANSSFDSDSRWEDTSEWDEAGRG